MHVWVVEHLLLGKWEPSGLDPQRTRKQARLDCLAMNCLNALQYRVRKYVRV